MIPDQFHIPPDEHLPVCLCAYTIAGAARFLQQLRTNAAGTDPILDDEFRWQLYLLTHQLTHLTENGHP
jgi:hypothetical protein